MYSISRIIFFKIKPLELRVILEQERLREVVEITESREDSSRELRKGIKIELKTNCLEREGLTLETSSKEISLEYC